MLILVLSLLPSVGILVGLLITTPVIGSFTPFIGGLIGFLIGLMLLRSKIQ
jgi:hypothetical protein